MEVKKGNFRDFNLSQCYFQLYLITLIKKEVIC